MASIAPLTLIISLLLATTCVLSRPQTHFNRPQTIFPQSQNSHRRPDHLWNPPPPIQPTPPGGAGGPPVPPAVPGFQQDLTSRCDHITCGRADSRGQCVQDLQCLGKLYGWG